MMISVASILAAAYFGLNFNPAMTNAATESRIYPISPAIYRMVQPDGVSRVFELTDAKQGILAGPKPWLGIIKGRQTDIWADPKYTGGKLRTAFTFVSGRLRLAVLDGEKYAFANGARQKGSLSDIFPERSNRSYEKNSSADIWMCDRSRLRLWFANPNSAGMLFAEILLVLFWVIAKTHGLVRIGVGVLAVASTYGLFATSSRGALAGLAVGLLPFVLAYGGKLFTRRGLLILLSGMLVFGGELVVSGKASRIVDTFRSVDAGNTTRLKIGSAAVKMFADAPTGWHGGEVPGRNACLNWYVFDESHIVRTHAVSLAECGWVKGFVYVFAWMLILVAGLVSAKKGSPLMAAIWMSFGVGGCFNPVYKDWETWIVPALTLLTLVHPGGRLTQRQWRTCALVSAGLSLAAVVAFVVAGRSLERSVKIPVRSCGKATFINGENPRIWVVGDPLVMAGGGFPGREILACLARNPKAGAVAYVYDVKDLPSEAESVIVAGRNVPDYLTAFAEGRACKAKRLLMLSPSISPESVSESLVAESNLIWVAGSLLADRDRAYAVKRSWIRLVPGCERYVPEWTGFLLQ